MASLVLVDTSVFVAFFRGRKSDELKKLIQENRVLLSNYVRLELFQGVKKQELRQIEYALGGLQPVPHEATLFKIAEKILLEIKGRGLTMGMVDLLIASEAKLMRCPVFSFDHIFQKLEELRLISCFSHSAER